MRSKYTTGNRDETFLTVREVAFLSGTKPQVISRITRLDLLRPAVDDPEPRFPPSVVPRVRRMLRIHRQLEVGWTSMALVLDLLDRIEELKTLQRGT